MANKITLGLEVVVLILAIVIMVLAYQNFEKSDQLWHKNMDQHELDRWRYERKP